MGSRGWPFRYVTRAARSGRQALPQVSRPIVRVRARQKGGGRAACYRDHEPPHFHATYGEYEATITIREGIVTGRFPRRALGHVLEWAELHRDELAQNWDRARAREPLNRIAPLE